MGIWKLQKLISDNKEDLCTQPRSIRGELIVDGYGVLHELYVQHNLDWVNGGCYAAQHRVTVDYFEALVRAGVKPIVVVDGGGCAQQLDDTVYRRGKDIVTMPHEMDHYLAKSVSHLLPSMARKVFISSLREKNIDVYVADGKATKTIVRLANYYLCPILTNTTNYCVCGVTGGVIFYNNFDAITCKGIIYEQTRLVEFCKLRNPDLVCAIVAIIGDGSDTSVPFLYRGSIRAQIEGHIIGKDLHGRSPILNVADFIRIKKLASFGDFKNKLNSLRFGWQCDKLFDNFQRAENKYNLSTVSTLSVEDLQLSTTIKCSKPCDIPPTILENYRGGLFPVLAIDAMTLGKCTLGHAIGDKEQPPPPMLGRPVRQLIYGLVSNLMNREGQAAIKEYHRSIDGSLKYEAHNVTPSRKHEELLTNTSDLERKTMRTLAVQAICEVLQCPEDIVRTLDSESCKSLAIVVLATCYWARHITEKEPLPNTEQLIKALVVNFFFNLSDPEAVADRQAIIDESKHFGSHWIQVKHALFEWQSLCHNVWDLNAMLHQPLEMISPSFLFDGPLIIFLALHPSPQIIDTYIGKLDPEKEVQCKNVLELVLTK